MTICWWILLAFYWWKFLIIVFHRFFLDYTGKLIFGLKRIFQFQLIWIINVLVLLLVWLFDFLMIFLKIFHRLWIGFLQGMQVQRWFFVWITKEIFIFQYCYHWFPIWCAYFTFLSHKCFNVIGYLWLFWDFLSDCTKFIVQLSIQLIELLDFIVDLLWQINELWRIDTAF